MNTDYIIVQAGGKGTRMQYLTENKPKALVPVGNRPMLFHLFEKFPDKRFVIIADYKSDVLKKYLAAFAKVNYLVVEANGKTGTCAGIGAAVRLVPSDTPFALIWSDLVLPNDFAFPTEHGNHIGLSENFRCRWKYENDRFEEIPSETTGVAGCFVFESKEALSDVPEEGEFVRWLKEKELTFQPFGLRRTKEYGLIGEWEKDYGKNEAGRCRPFNSIEVNGDVLVKTGIDEQGKALAVRERNWYRFVSRRGYSRIPKIYAEEPLTMQKINGKNIFAYDFTKAQRRAVLAKLVAALKELHTFGSVETDYFSVYNAYVGKTFDRLDKIRDMIPFANQKYITVNGRKCPNVYFFRDLLEKEFAHYRCDTFTFIHGDNTFSNMMLDENLDPVMIDPRGYFGYTELYGDPAYDWAKLYYSIQGNYDMFNLKRFRLHIGESDVRLDIQSNGWEDMSEDYLAMIADEIDERTIKLIHAVIWLSLTTYAWEDYDSICGAFYNGIYYLGEIWKEENNHDF